MSCFEGDTVRDFQRALDALSQANHEHNSVVKKGSSEGRPISLRSLDGRSFSSMIEYSQEDRARERRMDAFEDLYGKVRARSRKGDSGIRAAHNDRFLVEGNIMMYADLLWPSLRFIVPRSFSITALIAMLHL